MRSSSEIQVEMDALESKREDLKRQLRELERERNMALMREEMAAMSPEKRAAITAMVLRAHAIESGEAVGSPGK